MESLTLTPRKLSREDLVTGVGGSVLVHCMIVVVALVSAWVIPRKTFAPAAYTVNLVSMRDLGGDPAPAKKGNPAKTNETVRAGEASKSAPTTNSKTAPLVPVKRLQFDDAPRKMDAEIKRIETRDAPKVVENVQTASVEKSLDSLIPKPKALPKPSPIPQTPAKQQGASGEQGTAQADQSPNKNASSAAQEGRGHAKGAAEGSSRGMPDSVGAGDGGRVSSALIALYAGKVKDAIKREWAVLDSLKVAGLETRLLVVVSRDGRVLDLQVEKASGNGIFDDSAVRAVRKASPLPPIPEVYTLPKIEFAITFRPEGLS